MLFYVGLCFEILTTPFSRFTMKYIFNAGLSLQMVTREMLNHKLANESIEMRCAMKINSL